jgi:hypothetical protein
MLRKMEDWKKGALCMEHLMLELEKEKNSQLWGNKEMIQEIKL